jgi:hypothetical protein
MRLQAHGSTYTAWEGFLTRKIADKHNGEFRGIVNGAVGLNAPFSRAR